MKTDKETSTSPESAPPAVNEPISLTFDLTMIIAGLLIMVAALKFYLNYQHLDDAILQYFSAERTPAATNWAFFFSWLGNGLALSAMAVIVSVVCLIKKFWQGALQATFSLCLASLGSAIIKALLCRPRPQAILFNPLVSEPYFSFPSGHTTSSSALVIACLIIISRTRIKTLYKVLLSTLAVLMLIGIAWSRLYNAVHFPSDILAGLGLGIMANFAVQGLLKFETKISN